MKKKLLNNSFYFNSNTCLKSISKQIIYSSKNLFISKRINKVNFCFLKQNTIVILLLFCIFAFSIKETSSSKTFNIINNPKNLKTKHNDYQPKEETNNTILDIANNMILSNQESISQFIEDLSTHSKLFNNNLKLYNKTKHLNNTIQHNSAELEDMFDERKSKKQLKDFYNDNQDNSVKISEVIEFFKTKVSELKLNNQQISNEIKKNLNFTLNLKKDIHSKKETSNLAKETQIIRNMMNSYLNDKIINDDQIINKTKALFLNITSSNDELFYTLNETHFENMRYKNQKMLNDLLNNENKIEENNVIEVLDSISEFRNKIQEYKYLSEDLLSDINHYKNENLLIKDKEDKFYQKVSLKRDKFIEKLESIKRLNK